MNSNRLIKQSLTLASLLALTGMGMATVPPPMSDPCQADWDSRQPFRTVQSLNALKYLEREAERGIVSAQYRLGMIYSTKDGQWKAPEDGSYQIKWLQKAIQGGSKSAAAKLVEIQFYSNPPQIDYDTYLKTQIAAAEGDRNPWIATKLMYETNGRVGGRVCPEDQKANGWCIDRERHPLLPFTDARKWAEIAAEGGNPAAQEWLCRAADEGMPEYGQPKDDRAGFKWCLIAAHNACASDADGRLATYYREGVGTDKDEEKANLWRNIGKQLWRSNSRNFFNSQY